MSSLKVTMDPIEYEILSHRIFQIVNEARQGVMRVSGSPIVCEGGECLFAVYTAAGHCSAAACGLLLHIAGSHGFLDTILNEYADNPGIEDGDIFFFNDPGIGGIHACDQWMGTPLYYKGEIIAWLGALTHTPETGAIEPGGMPVSSRSLLHEGLRLQGVKIVRKGRMDPTILNTINKSVRDPGLCGLDIHSRIAGLNIGKTRLLELVKQHGIEKFKYILERMITHSSESARAKLKELANGTWRAVAYGDHDGIRYKPWKLMLTMTKEDDTITFDYTGSSIQNEGPVNCMWAGLVGSQFVAVASQLFWDVPWSYGMMDPVRTIAPEGTLINCKWLSPCVMCPPFPGRAISAISTICIAKMYYTNSKYHNDLNSAWTTCGHYPYYGGVNQYGIITGNMIGDCWASGTGAGINRDGVDTGANQMTVESNVADVEMNEMGHPLLYLWRREAQDCASPGRWRGGTGLSYAFMAHNTPGIQLGSFGIGRKISPEPSMDGAYPGSCTYMMSAHGTKLLEHLAKAEKPNNIQEVWDMLGPEGQVVELEIMNPSFPYQNGDVQAHDFMGSGGGIGDPLDREPDRVLMDYRNRIYSLEMCSKVFGVIIDPEKLQVDTNSTTKRREEIHSLRKKRGKFYKKGEA